MDNTYGILEWNNENSNSSYPLSLPFGVPDLIVDAAFVQFDGFVPVLKTVVVTTTSITFTITFDQGDVSFEVARPTSTFEPGQVLGLSDNTRHLGYLVFGRGLVNVFDKYLNATVKVSIPFTPSSVRGVSSCAGVYSIAGHHGEVNLITGDTRPTQTLFFDIEENDVTWNAGYVPAVSVAIPLRTLNGVAPVNNAVFVQDSDIIKVTPQGNSILISVAVPLTHDVISPATKFE